MKRHGSVVALIGALACASPAMPGSFADAIAAVRAGNPAGGAAIFFELAQAGDGEAMYNLALMFHSGMGTPQSTENALYWAWRARLKAVAKAPGLIEVISAAASKETRASVQARLVQEVEADIVAGAPLAFVRLSLIEEGLAAKPDMIKIYTWSAMAVSMGYVRAAPMRDGAFSSFSPRDAAKAEQALLDFHVDWCAKAGEQGGQNCAVPTVIALSGETPNG